MEAAKFSPASRIEFGAGVIPPGAGGMGGRTGSRLAAVVGVAAPVVGAPPFMRSPEPPLPRR